MRYYCVAERKSYKKIVSMLNEKNINYSIKKGKIPLSIIENTKKVYIFFVDENSISDVDDMLFADENITIDGYYLKHIVVDCSKRKKQIGEAIKIIVMLILTILFFLSPIGYIPNKNLVTVLAMLKLGLIIFASVYSAKRDPIAVALLMQIEGIAIFTCSSQFFETYSFEIIDALKRFHESYMFIWILGMIATLLIGMFYGLKNYYRNSLVTKLKFAALIVIGYLLIMCTTIAGYASLFQNYHNELYFKYQDKLMHESHIVNSDSSGGIIETEVDVDDGYEIIEGFYNKEYGSTELDMNPYRISVTKYDHKDQYIKRYDIEPAINTILQRDFSGTAMVSEYWYFSCITYFTIGYGDIYPIADVVKRWVIQEAIIAHVMSLLIVPLLLIIGQIFIDERNNKNLA